jgi:Ni/Fe-hydrogenase 1 B-type cytochrome subunit
VIRTHATEATEATEARDVSTPAPTSEVALEPVYVWDLVVRSTHWLIVLSMLVLVVTGIYIGRPFLLAPGAAGGRFVMGWVKIVHSYAAIVFSLAVLSRVIWMFRGPRFARWHQFLPVSAVRRRKMVETFKFYTMMKSSPPPTAGHNPLAGFTYIAVFALYGVMIFTGFALYSVSAYTSYMSMWDFLLPIFGGPQGARWLHHITMWLLIGFAVHHVFSGLLMSRVEKNGTLDSIFSGYKFLPRDRKPEDDE